MPKSLRKKQSEFARAISLLIAYAYQLGFELTFGDAWAKTGHRKGSFHYKRLAIDLNLFKDGIFQRTTEAHRPLGEFWESIGGTWGGRWDLNPNMEGHQGDGNHYSWGESRD